MPKPRRPQPRKKSPVRPPASAKAAITPSASAKAPVTTPAVSAGRASGPRVNPRAPVVGKETAQQLPWPRRGVTVLVTAVAALCLLTGLVAHAAGYEPDLATALSVPNPYVLILAFPVLAPLVRRLLDLRQMGFMEAVMLGMLVGILMLVASEIAGPALLPQSAKGETALQVYNQENTVSAAATMMGYILGIVLYKSFYRGFALIWRGKDPLATPKTDKDKPWWRPW